MRRLVVVLLAATALAGCSSAPAAPLEASPTAPPVSPTAVATPDPRQALASAQQSVDQLLGQFKRVRFDVTGSAADVALTMNTSSGGMSQFAHADVPLRTKRGKPFTFTAAQGDYLYISAQNNGSSGTVKCKITVNGVVVSRNASQGGYTIATCTASA